MREEMHTLLTGQTTNYTGSERCCDPFVCVGNAKRRKERESGLRLQTLALSRDLEWNKGNLGTGCRLHYGKYGYTDAANCFIELRISVKREIVGIERRTEAPDAAQQQR